MSPRARRLFLSVPSRFPHRGIIPETSEAHEANMQDSGLPQQFSPKRTVTIPQIERRVNQSSLNRDAKEPSCDNREEQYGISNESPQFPEGSHRLGCGYRRRRRTGRMLAERRLDRRIRRGRTGGWHRPRLVQRRNRRSHSGHGHRRHVGSHGSGRSRP